MGSGAVLGLLLLARGLEGRRRRIGEGSAEEGIGKPLLAL